jgi:hypothetical protein
VFVGLALALTVAACGGGDDDAAPADTSAETTTTLSEADTQAAVETVVTDYFRALGEGDIDAAVLLLEDGEEWRDEMEACSTLTAGVSASVKTVEVAEDGTVTATIDILGAEGNVLIEAQAGASQVDGEWVVSRDTFQSLYDLARDSCTGGTTSGSTTTAP